MTTSPVTDREPTPTPTPAPHTEGAEQGDESTRACAPARARKLSLPHIPTLAHSLFVGDGPSPLRDIAPRLRRRVNYALVGEWTAPPPLKADGRPAITGIRLAYLLLYTLPIACPVAIALDVLDWATHPAGRLAGAVLLVWLLTVVI